MGPNSPDQHRKCKQLLLSQHDAVTIVSRVICNTYAKHAPPKNFSVVDRDTWNALNYDNHSQYFHLLHKQTSIIKFRPTVHNFHFIAMFHLIFFHW